MSTAGHKYPVTNVTRTGFKSGFQPVLVPGQVPVVFDFEVVERGAVQSYTWSVSMVYDKLLRILYIRGGDEIIIRDTAGALLAKEKRPTRIGDLNLPCAKLSYSLSSLLFTRTIYLLERRKVTVNSPRDDIQLSGRSSGQSSQEGR